MTEPTPKTRTLTSSWYTTSQACGPAGTSQQRPLTQMRSFITEGSETKVHACSWSNRSRCQRAEYLKPNGSEPEAAHRTIRQPQEHSSDWAQGVCADQALTEHVLERGRHGVLPVQKQALDDLQRLPIALLFSTAEHLHVGVVEPSTERVEVLVHTQGPEVCRRHVNTRRALDHAHWSPPRFATTRPVLHANSAPLRSGEGRTGRKTFIRTSQGTV